VAVDRRVTFRIRAPKASAVAVSGEFASRLLHMQRDEAGVWSVTTEPLAPEIYNYNFLIDDVRTLDLSNPLVKSGSTGRTISSILEIPAETPAFYDLQPVPHGVVHECLYPSKSLNTTRSLYVYTPPGYDSAKSERYPVLYLLHGANANESAWTRLGRANAIIDNLIAAGQATPMIIVMPFGYTQLPGTHPAGVGPGGGRDLFARDLIEDVIPFVENTFRVLIDREHRALTGLSMGGGQALFIGLRHLDMFSYVGGFEPAISSGRSHNSQAGFENWVSDPKITDRQLRLLWFGCGTEDTLFEANKSLSEFLTERGVRHDFYTLPGAHTWIVARRLLNEFAPKLFKD
jgi:enterochelin esterase family protein